MRKTHFKDFFATEHVRWYTTKASSIMSSRPLSSMSIPTHPKEFINMYIPQVGGELIQLPWVHPHNVYCYFIELLIISIS